MSTGTAIVAGVVAVALVGAGAYILTRPSAPVPPPGYGGGYAPYQPPYGGGYAPPVSQGGGNPGWEAVLLKLIEQGGEYVADHGSEWWGD